MGDIATTEKGLEEAGISLEELANELQADSIVEIDPNGDSEVLLVDPLETVPGDWNIRETSSEHIKRLAESIGKQGQLQPCLGVIDEEGRVKIWAGQHRRLAVIVLNMSLVTEDKNPRKIEVKVFRKGLTAKQVLQIQISENLQRPMSSLEEAETIYDICQYYKSVENPEATIGEIAKSIGRTEDQVRNAMYFARLDPVVAQWAREGVITYTTALQISRIDAGEKGEMAHQNAARWIIERDLDGEQVRVYVGNLIEGDPFDDGLFSLNGAVAQVNAESASASLKLAWAKAGANSEGYFTKIQHLIRAYGPKRVRFSKGVESLTKDLVVVSARFTHWLREVDPDRYEKFYKEVKASTGPVPFWMVKPKGSRKKKK